MIRRKMKTVGLILAIVIYGGFDAYATSPDGMIGTGLRTKSWTELPASNM